MKLFAIYVGGELPGANIELHDMRFVLANSILDTYDELRRQWWGAPDSLHIDCWAELDRADGFDIFLSPDPFDGQDRLFYVNLGGYDRLEFSEKHKNLFIVATSATEAKTKALNSITDWRDLHRDDLYQAEQVIALQEINSGHRFYIHLSQNDSAIGPRFTCKYTPLKLSAP